MVKLGDREALECGGLPPLFCAKLWRESSYLARTSNLFCPLHSPVEKRRQAAALQSRVAPPVVFVGRIGNPSYACQVCSAPLRSRGLQSTLSIPDNLLNMPPNGSIHASSLNLTLLC